MVRNQVKGTFDCIKNSLRRRLTNLPLLFTAFSVFATMGQSRVSKMMTIHPVFGVERRIEIPCPTFPHGIFPTIEEIDEMESHMPGCEHEWFPSSYDGSNVQLHYRKWIPTNKTPPKAVVIWMHGISDHSGVALITKSGRKLGMSLLSSTYLQNNIALYAFDMYGHGYSEGERAFIPETWENNKQDYITFCNEIVVPDLIKKYGTSSIPLFLSGESYGGCLTIHVAKHFQEHPNEPAGKLMKGMILNAPAVIGDLPPPPVVFVLRYCLAPYFPTWIPFFMPNPISPDRIWRDPEVLARNSMKGRYMNMGLDMSGRPFRLGTAVNLLLALEVVRDVAIPGLKVPFVCQHGTSDYGVPISGSELLYDKCSTPTKDKVFHRHTGGYHDLLAEPNAEQIVQNMIDFINQRI